MSVREEHRQIAWDDLSGKEAVPEGVLAQARNLEVGVKGIPEGRQVV